MKILDYLNEENVISGLKKSGKKEVIEKLVSFMLDSGVNGDSGKIISALVDREKTGSTGIGNGVAIPHAKTDAVDRIGMVYAYSPSGVEFDSVDGEPANFFFLVVSPPSESSAQLRLLARISRLMGNRLLRKDLSEAESPGEVISTIGKYDR